LALIVLKDESLSAAVESLEMAILFGASGFFGGSRQILTKNGHDRRRGCCFWHWYDI